MIGSEGFFGPGILTMGKWIERAQVVGYLGRVFLMSLGMICLEFLLAMKFDMGELLNVSHIFTGKLLDADPGLVMKVAWVLFGYFLLHLVAFFFMGWKKFLKTLDGDEVAVQIFEDMNTTLLDDGEVRS